MSSNAPPPEHERAGGQPTQRQRLIVAVGRWVRWADEKLPRGLRSLLGLLLVVAGLLGFLPILGFWMAPLGAALIALDIPPLRRRLMSWLDRHRPHQ